MINILVGGLEHDFYFPCHIWDVILPIDELIFFKMVNTTNQILCTNKHSRVTSPCRDDFRERKAVRP